MAILDVDTQEKIRIEAESLLQETRFQNIFPCPVEKIISKIGFSGHLFSPDTETKNISGAVDRHNKKIYINEEDSAQRRLFTAAHEIGHLRLHPHNDHVDYRGTFINHDIKEKEADFFAACLLMPEIAFRKQWQRFSGDVLRLSNYFGTSRKAILFRADDLGLE